MSVTEIARIQTSDGDEFARLLGRGVNAIRAADGCRSAVGGRCVERPDEFVLIVEWDDVAAHEAFANTPAFHEFAQAISHLLAAPPEAAHYEIEE